jgi:hypothetical protein
MEDEWFASSFPDDVLRIVLTDGPERAVILGVSSTSIADSHLLGH